MGGSLTTNIIITWVPVLYAPETCNVWRGGEEGYVKLIVLVQVLPRIWEAIKV